MSNTENMVEEVDYIVSDDRADVDYTFADGTLVEVHYHLSVSADVSPEAWGVEVECEILGCVAMQVSVTTEDGECRNLRLGDDDLAYYFANEMFAMVADEAADRLASDVPVSASHYRASARALAASY